MKQLEAVGVQHTDFVSASIKEAAATVAFGLAKFYTGNNTGDNPGNLPEPHYCTYRTVWTSPVAVGSTNCPQGGRLVLCSAPSSTTGT